MEKWRYQTRIGINAGEVRSLVEITFRASKSQIVRIVRTAMLARNNVLNVEAQIGEVLRQATILATVSSPLANKLARRRVHQAALARTA